jgi:CMP-N,N'-diacetyllegionaminic acid synthase
MPSCVALIPARRGSKRVPGKNIRVLGMHPMLAYSIAAAHESGVFDTVMVSTDCEVTAAIARHYGAEVPFLRPTSYASDSSPDIDWVEHMLGALREQGRSWDAFSLLRPTSPFRSADTIRRAWRRFSTEEGVDSLRAVEKCTQHPCKMWMIHGNRMFPLLPFGPSDPPWHSTPYQALPVVYVQNASLEMAWTRTVFTTVCENGEGFDINDPHDWVVAEHLVAEGGSPLPPVNASPFGGSTRTMAHG